MQAGGRRMCVCSCPIHLRHPRYAATKENYIKITATTRHSRRMCRRLCARPCLLGAVAAMTASKCASKLWRLLSTRPTRTVTTRPVRRSARAIVKSLFTTTAFLCAPPTAALPLTTTAAPAGAVSQKTCKKRVLLSSRLTF